MKRTILSTLVLLGALSAQVSSVWSRGLSSPHVATSSSPNLLYIASHHLWLRPLAGGSARLVATPWPVIVQNNVAPVLEWAPDARRIAIADAGGRLAIINLISGRITRLLNRSCGQNCGVPAFTWSPNGRYLALTQPIGTGERALLRVWDSTTGKTHRLLRNLAGYVAYPEWSHDSTRIATEVGTFNPGTNVYSDAVVVDLAGHVVHVGQGQYLTWSPDDRLLGILRPNTCGANACDEDVIVESSTGGVPITLERHSNGIFDNPVWAPQPQGYAFDRWLLNASGEPTKRLAGPHERVLSWKPDGSLLALQTYYPYQETRDVLYLSTPAGQRTRFYADVLKSNSCGACSKDVYGITWGPGNLFAFSTRTYPTPKNVTVYPKFFVASTGGGPLSRIDVSGRNIVEVLGFVDSGRELVVRSGRTVFTYTVSSHTLSTILTGVTPGYGTVLIDPTAVNS